MLMDLLHGFEVLSTTEETLFNSRNVSRLVLRVALTFAIIDNLTIMKEKLFKSVFINIEFCNKTLLVGCLYRSPSSDVQSNEIFVSTLKNCLNLLKFNQKCIITGDLNYDLAKL